MPLIATAGFLLSVAASFGAAVAVYQWGWRGGLLGVDTPGSMLGFIHGSKVVLVAALIMASVFAGFVFAHLTMIRPIGFALAVGVLVDVLLVRMTLTPAVLHLLGEAAWWMPRWLDRLLPNFDVEGTDLEAEPVPSAPATEKQLVTS